MRADQSLDLYARAAAALLAVGDRAVLSGPTAVEMHGCSAAASRDVHVTMPFDGAVKSRPGLVVHRGRLAADDIVDIGGLPVLAYDLALAELLCAGDKRNAFASLDQALYGLDRMAVEAMKATIGDRLAARRDRRGVARAQMLTELATGKADSPPESMIRLDVVEAGFPVPTPQYAILAMDGALLYLLDMAWESVRIALEYDGYAAHEDRVEYDAERDRRLAGRGWIVVRARAADLRDSTRVLAELGAAFARRA